MTFELQTETQDIVVGKYVKAPGVSHIEFTNGSKVVRSFKSYMLHYFLPSKKGYTEVKDKDTFLSVYKSPAEKQYIDHIIEEFRNLQVLPGNHALWTSPMKQAEFVPLQFRSDVQRFIHHTESNRHHLYDIINAYNLNFYGSNPSYCFIEHQMFFAWGKHKSKADKHVDYLLGAYIIKGTARTNDPVLITFGANSLSEELPSTLILPASEWLSCVNYYALTTKADRIADIGFVS